MFKPVFEDPNFQEMFRVVVNRVSTTLFVGLLVILLMILVGAFFWGFHRR